MKKIIFIIVVAFLVSSCTTLQPFTFERLQAADVSFSEQVRMVGVVNNVPKNDLNGQKPKTPFGLWYGDGRLVAETLAQEIAATNYFDQVVICDSALHKVGFTAGEPLPAHLADSLIRLLGVDMLFAVEHVQVELKRGKLFLPEMMAELLVIDGVVTPVVRSYIAGRNAPLFSISNTDSIYWELSPELTYDKMIEEASVYAAKLPVDYLLPHWTEVNRYYFDGGNADMRDAGVYVREQNWEEASVLWQQLYDTRRGKVKMRAAYNLALYYELQTDFLRTKEYLDAALALAPEGSWEQQLIESYLLQIEGLNRKNQQLKVQMNRFEP